MGCEVRRRVSLWGRGNQRLNGLRFRGTHGLCTHSLLTSEPNATDSRCLYDLYDYVRTYVFTGASKLLASSLRSPLGTSEHRVYVCMYMYTCVHIQDNVQCALSSWIERDIYIFMYCMSYLTCVLNSPRMYVSGTFPTN